MNQLQSERSQNQESSIAPQIASKDLSILREGFSGSGGTSLSTLEGLEDSMADLNHRQWFLHSALAVLASQEPTALNFRFKVHPQSSCFISAPELKTQIRQLFESLSRETEKQKKRVREVTEWLVPLEEREQVAALKTQLILRDASEDERLAHSLEELTSLQQLVAEEEKRRQILEAKRTKTPWYTEAQMLKKEVEGLRLQKSVLLSKLAQIDPKLV